VKASDQRHQVERIAHRHTDTPETREQKKNRIIVIRKKKLVFPWKIFRLVRRACVIASSIFQLGRFIAWQMSNPFEHCVCQRIPMSITRTTSADLKMKYLGLKTTVDKVDRQMS
jgi:hypothetical protein